MTHQTGTTKQTRETARKARILRELKALGATWEDAAAEVGIIKEDGSPNPGLAHKIAEGYEPKRPETRERLGLRAICFACMRGIRKASEGARALSPWRSWWKRLSPDDRDKMIREHYEKENQ